MSSGYGVKAPFTKAQMLGCGSVIAVIAMFMFMFVGSVFERRAIVSGCIKTNPVSLETLGNQSVQDWCENELHKLEYGTLVKK